ncbi:MAG: tRNA (guanosine(37)-N1)-methyltransferase TrmD [Solobacterium sp.]|nr:tRNA (guanosine(37)-N1)-methyltransferase TrmD [Solobacterium sp.]
MKIDVLTLFPELFDAFQTTSIIGRAIQNEVVHFSCVNIRDFALDKYKHVDDAPFGGGAGMVMKPQPLMDALNTVKEEKSHIVFLTPSGTPYTQEKAHTLAQKEHLILICGHYEGIDHRIEEEVDECISIGDYVLTGGEIPAMVVLDSVIRLLDGVIRKESTEEESFENGLLEYPQYTQPALYNGKAVPEVLLSGNHEKIRKWRLQQSLLLTKERRPDLFEKYELNEEEKKLLEEVE